jgi:hypothetical protein
MVFYTIGLSLILSLSCVTYTKYVPNPETDINFWIKNFEQQISLSYDYEMSVGSVRVHAAGDCVIGEGEMLEGKWERDGAAQIFEYVGLGDMEYARKGKEWEKSSRGEQSDIFTQIKRILTFDKFEYTGFDKGFWYRFTANVPFLAPERRKEMVGQIRISSRNFLPEFIWTGLPDSSVYWTSRILEYNTRKRIRPPVREYHVYDVVLSAQSVDDEYKRLRKRLDLIDVEHQLNLTSQGVQLRLPFQYRLEDVEIMLRPGGLVVYSVALEGKDASRVGYLKDDMHTPVLLGDTVLTERDISDAVIKYDQRSAAYISVKLRRRVDMPSTVAFQVDSVLIATAALDTTQKLNRIEIYPEMQYHDMKILRSYIMQPLGGLKIKPAGGEPR